MTLDLSCMFGESNPRWNDYFYGEKSSSFPIFIRCHEKYGRTSFHRQPGIEIHITHEGRGVLLIDKEPVLQSPKQVVIFRADTPHQLTSDPSMPYSRTALCFDDARICHPALSDLTDLSWITADELINFQMTPADYARIDELTQSLNMEMNQKKEGWEQLSYAYLLHSLGLLRRMAATAKKRQSSPARGTTSTLLQNCLDYIRQNLSGDLSLTHIASVFSMSPEHLTRIFAKEHGISLYQFVLLSRVSEAKRLLQLAPHMTITDIALTVGFESSGQLSRTFRNITQESPASYRKKALGTSQDET